MNISLEGRSKQIVEHLVETGRFASASEVVDDALHLAEERERHTAALRAKVQAALAEGGEVTDEELDTSLAATMEELQREGY